MKLEKVVLQLLGSAILLAISLASQSGSGSKVIVCTEGVANIGLGNLKTDEYLEFYDKISKLAQELGVEVSVISISEEECRLDAFK